jgi:dihydroorotate dehydrogenase electron transfer subunit
MKNEPVAANIWRMEIGGAPEGKAGQFVMLRAPGALDPFLGRPISLFDSEGDHMSLLYQVKGRGTEAFARLRAGQEIDAQGPYGNGFPLAPGDAALIGGGIGVAPLYLLA